MIRKGTSGQALVEHLVLWPTLILVSMAAIQLGFLFRGKSTLETATFMAAREGSINNAFKAPIKKMLAQAMAPLDMKANPNPANYALVAGVAGIPGTTYAANFIPPKAIGGADIEIISPSKAIFNQFAKNQHVLVSCTSGCPGGGSFREAAQTVKQIPNDNLSVRPATVIAVGSTNINIQDANLLKIRTHWCFPLEVPIVNIAIYQTMNLLHPSTPELASCSAKTVASKAVLGWSTYYIPLSASSVVRMQSAVRCEDSACSNLGVGGTVVVSGSGTGSTGSGSGGGSTASGSGADGTAGSNGSNSSSNNTSTGDTAAGSASGVTCNGS